FFLVKAGVPLPDAPTLCVLGYSSQRCFEAESTGNGPNSWSYKLVVSLDADAGGAPVDATQAILTTHDNLYNRAAQTTGSQFTPGQWQYAINAFYYSKTAL